MTRISYPLLGEHKNSGRINFPNLRNDYFAARLDQAKPWFDPNSDKLWVQIEKSIMGNKTLPTLLLSYLTRVNLNYRTCPSTETTLLAWYKLHTIVPPESMENCRDFPLKMYKYFIPNFSIQQWMHSDI